jgi:hypothetical protein
MKSDRPGLARSKIPQEKRRDLANFVVKTIHPSTSDPGVPICSPPRARHPRRSVPDATALTRGAARAAIRRRQRPFRWQRAFSPSESSGSSSRTGRTCCLDSSGSSRSAAATARPRCRSPCVRPARSSCPRRPGRTCRSGRWRCRPTSGARRSWRTCASTTPAGSARARRRSRSAAWRCRRACTCPRRRSPPGRSRSSTSTPWRSPIWPCESRWRRSRTSSRARPRPTSRPSPSTSITTRKRPAPPAPPHVRSTAPMRTGA